jgi:8-oxo-dGTP pyrophosphatase MutT (NUDIX family)
MIKRPDGSEIHARQICLPGGGIDGEESTTEAALRECREEIGWCPRDSEIVGQLSPIYVYASNNLVTPVVAVSTELPVWALSAAEVAELVELPLQHLCSAASLGMIELQRHSLAMNARCFTWQGHTIWGATAMILSELRQVLLAVRDECVDCVAIQSDSWPEH